MNDFEKYVNSLKKSQTDFSITKTKDNIYVDFKNLEGHIISSTFSLNGKLLSSADLSECEKINSENLRKQEKNEV